jgi:hypothetical protein
MPISQNLRKLIDLNAPLWSGEAEIIRTYWTSPVRTRATDKLWLKRQCWKEYAGLGDSEGTTIGMVGDLEVKLKRMVPRIDVDLDRHELEELLEKVCVEYRHYCLFADIHDTMLDPGESKLNANKLEPWPEEVALASCRVAVKRSNKRLGWRATDFTEGGHCTMYSEGAKLKGKPGLDGMIGRACQKVFDDEYAHMMHGVVGIDDAGLTKGDWDELAELTLEQLRLRIYMRNAEFSHPVSDQRIKEILDGKIEPIEFDYARAEAYLAEAHGIAAE